MIKYFFKRINFKSVSLSLLIGLFLSLIQLYMTISPELLMRNQFYDSPYTKWLSIDPFNFSPVIFFILLPIIASIPSAIILKEDIDSGFIMHLTIHNKKFNILKGYVITAFISGFFVITIILFSNFFVYFLFLPDIIPNMSLNNNLLINYQNTMLVSIYYSQPFLHALMSVIFTSFFGGLFSAFVTVNSLIIKNKFTVLISGLLLEVFLLMLDTFLKLPNDISYVPSDFLKESANSHISLTVSLVITLILSLYILFMLIYGGKKID